MEPVLGHGTQVGTARPAQRPSGSWTAPTTRDPTPSPTQQLPRPPRCPAEAGPPRLGRGGQAQGRLGP